MRAGAPVTGCTSPICTAVQELEFDYSSSIKNKGINDQESVTVEKWEDSSEELSHSHFQSSEWGARWEDSSEELSQFGSFHTDLLVELPIRGKTRE